MKSHIENLFCPACDIGVLEPHIDSETYEYKGRKFNIEDIECSKCSSCNTVLFTPSQQKVNAIRVREEQKEIDGLLTSTEIKQIREKLRLTQSQASLLFGGGVNAFSRYERGEIVQSMPMDRLLRLVDIIPSSINVLQNISKVKIISMRRDINLNEIMSDIQIFTGKKYTEKKEMLAMEVNMVSEAGNDDSYWTKEVGNG